MKIASVEKVDLGSIIELSVSGQVLKCARQSNFPGGSIAALLSLLLPIVAAFWCFLPARIGCKSMERDVMGDMYRYRNDTSKLS